MPAKKEPWWKRLWWYFSYGSVMALPAAGGVLAGMKFGAVIGTLIAPGVGTAIGAAIGAAAPVIFGLVGAALGAVAGYFSPKIRHFMGTFFGTMGVGAGIGASVGAVLGTFLLPGLGTAAGAAAGAWIGSVIGLVATPMVNAIRNWYKDASEGDNRRNRIFATTSGIAAGAGLGAAIGSVVPVIGTAIGALAGAALVGLYGFFSKNYWIKKGSAARVADAKAAANESIRDSPPPPSQDPNVQGLELASRSSHSPHGNSSTATNDPAANAERIRELSAEIERLKAGGVPGGSAPPSAPPITPPTF